MTALVAGEEVLATFLAVADGRCCTVIRSSQLMSDPWRAYGLGKLIMAQSMQGAASARLSPVFDLSIGDLPYKRDFGVAEMPLFDLDVAGSWRAVPVLACDRIAGTPEAERDDRWSGPLDAAGAVLVAIAGPPPR